MSLGPPAMAAPSNGSTKEARRLAQAGQTAYDLGNFEEALQDFSKSYELAGKPGLLFNIAQCHRQLKNFERAAFFYRRFLSLSPDAENSDKVHELIKEMEGKQADLEKAASAKPPETLSPTAESKTPPTNPGEWAAPPAAGSAEPPPPAAVDVAKAGDAAAVKVAAAEPPSSASSPEVKAEAKPTGLAAVPWWVWVGAGVVVAGCVVGGMALFHPQPPTPSLGTISQTGGYSP
jgi:hypothetical protein